MKEDRLAALRRAFACLKGNGILFSALVSRFGMLGSLLKKLPSWIENQSEVQSILARGHRPEEAPRGGFRGYFVKLDKIAPLHEEVGFETLAVAGVEPAISADDESYNGLEGDGRRLWLDVLFRVSS